MPESQFTLCPEELDTGELEMWFWPTSLDSPTTYLCGTTFFPASML